MATLPTFKERFEYLKLNGKVGVETFGYDRFFNQTFYKSPEWSSIRSKIILRDSHNGYACDLGDPERPILGPIFIHHMNPIDVNDISFNTPWLLEENYLVCVSFKTHNAIHYGRNVEDLFEEFKDRTPNDMIPWR